MIALARALRRRRLDPAQQLLFAQLVMFTGIAAIFPVVPLYVAHRGGGSGMIVVFVAGPMIANTVMQLPGGHLVDRIGRKPVLIGSRLGYAAASLVLFADSGPLWLMATFRILQGVSGGLYVPALRSALADLTPVHRRGERYAQLQAVEMVGLLIGPLLGGAVALWRDSGIFGVSAMGVLLGLVNLFRLDETRVATGPVQSQAPPGWWRTRGLMIPGIGVAALGAVFSMYDVIWPQYLTARGYSALVIGVSVSLFALPILLLASLAGRVSDRANRRWLVGLSFVLGAICLVTYPVLRDIRPILLLGAIEAVAMVAIEPTLFAVISESALPSVRGRAMGVGGLFQFGGSAAGACFLGLLYGVGEPLPFRVAAVLFVLTGGVCLIALPARRARHEPNPASAVIDLEARG